MILGSIKGYIKFAKLQFTRDKVSLVSSVNFKYSIFYNTIYCNICLSRVRLYEYLNIIKHPTKRNNK